MKESELQLYAENNALDFINNAKGVLKDKEMFKSCLIVVAETANKQASEAKDGGNVEESMKFAFYANAILDYIEKM